MSEQAGILASIERLESALAGWFSLHQSDDWRSVDFDEPSRDLRQIIAAYDPVNPLGALYRHDPLKKHLVREVFSDSDYQFALAVEKDLKEHGPIVTHFLLRLNNQAANTYAGRLMGFLANRGKEDADRLPEVFQRVRQIVLLADAEANAAGNPVEAISPQVASEAKTTKAQQTGTSASNGKTRKVTKRKRNRKPRTVELLLVLLEDRTKANLNYSELAEELKVHVSSVSRAFKHPTYGPELVRRYHSLGYPPPRSHQV